MTAVLKGRVSLDVDKDDALVLTTREESSAGHRWNDVHHEALMVKNFFLKLVLASATIQSVNLVAKIYGSAHEHVRSFLETKGADGAGMAGQGLRETVLIGADGVGKWVLHDVSATTSGSNLLLRLSLISNFFESASFLCHIFSL